jgi:hypothetical protein
MNEVCRHEPNVRRAAAEDRWSEALRTHVQECPDCAAAAAVAPFMTNLTKIEERRHKLPDPTVVWVKAQLLGSVAVADRVTRPLNAFQMVAYIIVAGGWASLLVWKWTDLHTWVLRFAAGHASVSLTATIAVALLASMTVMLALHTILVEE